MSILIKNMEMPKNCETCELSSTDSSGFFGCCVTGNIVLRKREQDKPSWCPLVGLPPHGRLIDADELRWCYDNSGVADDVITKENYDQLKVAVAVVRQTIDDAPTIIEAEEAEDA